MNTHANDSFPMSADDAKIAARIDRAMALVDQIADQARNDYAAAIAVLDSEEYEEALSRAMAHM